MSFSFLHSYKIDAKLMDVSEAESIGRKKHLFFSVPEIDYDEALKTFDPFPLELKIFYKEIGFGFLHRSKGKLNILLDPISVVNTNLRLGYYKDNPYLVESFKYCENEKQLLFFKMHTGQYLLISRIAVQGKNAVFYKEKQIDSSLYNFLHNYSQNPDYLKNHIDDLIQEETKRKKGDLGNPKNTKSIGGHILVDPYYNSPFKICYMLCRYRAEI